MDVALRHVGVTTRGVMDSYLGLAESAFLPHLIQNQLKFVFDDVPELFPSLVGTIPDLMGVTRPEDSGARVKEIKTK